MATFKTVTELVLRNSTGGELNRVEIRCENGLDLEYGVTGDNKREAFSEIVNYGLYVGDTITVEERETEVE